MVGQSCAGTIVGDAENLSKRGGLPVGSDSPSTSEMETGRVDRHRSGRPTARVAGRVEILRPAGQTVEKPVKFSFLAAKRHLSINRNILIYFIIHETFYQKTVLTNPISFKNTCRMVSSCD